MKPANLMRTKDGRVKISDFGISSSLDSTMGMCSTFVGTANYMSPERLSGGKRRRPQPVTQRRDTRSARRRAAAQRRAAHAVRGATPRAAWFSRILVPVGYLVIRTYCARAHTRRVPVPERVQLLPAAQ